jgi:hypothetical protein
MVVRQGYRRGLRSAAGPTRAVIGRDRLQAPDDVEKLEAWIADVLDGAGPERAGLVLVAVEQAAGDRFPSDVVVAAIRHVFATMGTVGHQHAASVVFPGTRDAARS